MNAIKAIRMQLGMSQEVLAASLGKTKTSISHYETGRYQMPVDDAKKLIQVAAENGVSITLDRIYASGSSQEII